LLAVAGVALCLLCADAAARRPTRSERAIAVDLAAMSATLPMDFPATAEGSAFRGVPTLRLCEALRDSYLPGPDDSPEQNEWERVRMRGHLLDEIERRDPAGFDRWLATLPKAGSDPSRYLSVGR
jgi:hypothetical protein